MKRFVCLLLVLALFSPVTALGTGLEVEAKSACLMEVNTGTVLYEYNASAPLPPASVTKIMTLLLIMEAVDSGALGWEDTVTASETAAAKGGSQVYLKAGETMTVRDMVKSIAVSSANDCACAMAEHLAGSEGAFVARMNQRAGELGMENTHFVNCTGLDDGPEAKDHRTSAMDIAIMSRELLKNHPGIREFTTIWMDTIRGGEFGLSNTNKLVRFYQGATGLKTGFTAAAGYCLSASAERDGMQLIAVVMGAESSQARFAACKQLLDYGFAGYTLYTPQIPVTPRIPVVLGKNQEVLLTPQGAAPLLVEKGKAGSITVETELSPQVQAPVAQGQQLGTLRIRSGEELLGEYPLTAARPVEKLSWWDIFLRILRRAAMAG